MISVQMTFFNHLHRLFYVQDYRGPHYLKQRPKYIITRLFPDNSTMPMASQTKPSQFQTDDDEQQYLKTLMDDLKTRLRRKQYTDLFNLEVEMRSRLNPLRNNPKICEYGTLLVQNAIQDEKVFLESMRLLSEVWPKGRNPLNGSVKKNNSVDDLKQFSQKQDKRRSSSSLISNFWVGTDQ